MNKNALSNYHFKIACKSCHNAHRGGKQRDIIMKMGKIKKIIVAKHVQEERTVVDEESHLVKLICQRDGENLILKSRITLEKPSTDDFLFKSAHSYIPFLIPYSR